LKRHTISAILRFVITAKSYITDIVMVKALDHITGAVPPHLKVSVAKKPKIIVEFYFLPSLIHLPYDMSFQDYFPG
jgi:hypothetical protein